MSRFSTRRLGRVAACLLLVAAFAALVWAFAYREALDQLDARGRADLALAADSLEGELSRYRNLAVVLAGLPEITASLDRDRAATGDPALLEIKDKTGAIEISVVDAAGRVRAQATDLPPRDHAGTLWLDRARHGALGIAHLYDPTYGERAFVFAAPVFSPAGPVSGAVIVVASIEALEAEWRGGRPALFFTDDLGVIFVSNRSELIFRARTGAVREAALSDTYPAGRVTPFRQVQSRSLFGHEIWRLDGRRYLPDEGLHLTLPVPTTGLTGEILLDVAPARQLALLQAAVAAAILLFPGTLLLLGTERRRALAEANTRLEARVADRTAQLQGLNADLHREVAERREAEARLRQAQADLVQAGKLSALGQMSAGISHELNQPLMAIRSFAENARAFLDKGQTETTGQNLERISQLAHRMGRIIKNLRAFARQDPAELQDVDLAAVVQDAVDMIGPRLRDEDVTLHWTPPADPVFVRGGDVRLHQVTLNLLTNALDAMQTTADRHLTVAIETGPARASLIVRDNGPGLAEPEKVFEPFYSTKQQASADGMGLGLSISYGLVQSFGGQIRGRTHPDGGAEFRVDLDAVPRAEAA